MPPDNNHIIQKQSVRLRLGSQADSWELQQLTADVLQNSALLALLDKVLSEIVPDNQWLELNTISVDLGLLQKADFEKQFAQRLPGLLREQLMDALPAALQDGEATVQSKQQTVLAAFLYFLSYGLWPEGSTAPASIAAFEQQLFQVLTDCSPNQRSALTETLLHPNARRRLIRQFSESFCLEVLQLAEAAPVPVAAGILKKLKLIGAMPDAAATENAWGWVLEQAVRQRVENLELFARFLEKLPDRNANKETAPATIAAAVHAYLTSVAAGVVAGAAQKKPYSAEESTTKKTRIAQPNTEPPAPDLPAASLFVQQAGLVLLHPFLSTCFDACGWLVEGKSFRDEQAQVSAMLLLHFLTTGETQAAEYELLLPKLLCGFPLTSPVPGHMQLTKLEEAEGIALLEAAIAQWGALKNTTPSGLRDGFLQRDGKLHQQPDSTWLLTVEQKAQDILLDRLPYGWGISMVHLPWMNSMLHINWV